MDITDLNIEFKIISNVEDEFKQLMQEAIAKINSKKSAGEYNSYEADSLIKMVNSCIDNGGSFSDDNSCPEGHLDPDCGWSPSMGYHCY